MSGFLFGFAREDITPRQGVSLAGYFNARPNAGVLDRLSVKAAVFSCNGVTAGIVSLELCALRRNFVDDIINGLKAAGADYAENVLISAIHTHTGPDLFNPARGDEATRKMVVEKTVSAVLRAAESMTPAELYATVTENSELTFNRRFVMKGGEVVTNPGKLNPDIDRPEGPIDPEIPVLAVKKAGLWQMILANISNHTDTIGGNLVSADWPGRMEKYLQNEIGYDVPVMTLVAPQGNINHFNVKTAADQTSYAEANRIGKGYGATVAAAMYQLLPVKFDDIRISKTELEVFNYQLSDEEYEEAKATAEKYKDAKIEAGHDLTSEDIIKGTPYVRKMFAERAIACWEQKEKSAMERMLAIKFGNSISISTFPCEAFVELGLAVKATKRFPLMLVAALGMGDRGYIGLPGHYHATASYETRPGAGVAAPDSGLKMVEAAKKLLED